MIFKHNLHLKYNSNYWKEWIQKHSQASGAVGEHEEISGHVTMSNQAQNEVVTVSFPISSLEREIIVSPVCL